MKALEAGTVTWSLQKHRLSTGAKAAHQEYIEIHRDLQHYFSEQMNHRTSPFNYSLLGLGAISSNCWQNFAEQMRTRAAIWFCFQMFMEVCYHLTRSALCLKIKQSAPPKKRVTSGQLLHTPCRRHSQVLIFKAGKAITAAVRICKKQRVCAANELAASAWQDPKLCNCKWENLKRHTSWHAHAQDASPLMP